MISMPVPNVGGCTWAPAPPDVSRIAATTAVRERKALLVIVFFRGMVRSLRTPD
jgi:hypothetical protein